MTERLMTKRLMNEQTVLSDLNMMTHRLMFGDLDVEAAKAVARCGPSVTLDEAIRAAGPILQDHQDSQSRIAAIWAGATEYAHINGECRLLYRLPGRGGALVEEAQEMAIALDAHEYQLDACEAVYKKTNSQHINLLPWIWAGANAMRRHLNGQD